MTPKRRAPQEARRRSKARPDARAARKVPAHHWDWPVSFRSDGSRRRATLAEYVDPGVPTLTLAELSPAQREELVLARIGRRREFPLVLANGGYVDKARAITEVRHHTAVGQVIEELELRMMRRLVEHASPQRAPRDFFPKGRRR